MIWHLPHIRAIAAHVGEPVTLITKPRSAADQIFSAERTVRDIFWLDRNPEGRQGKHDGGAGFLRAVAALRARRFDAVYLLHHSRTIALQTMLAGIPVRYGYGYGTQRWFLNRPPYLSKDVLKSHPFDQATTWLRAAGIPLPEAEPILPVTEAAIETVRSRLQAKGETRDARPLPGLESGSAGPDEPGHDESGGPGRDKRAGSGPGESVRTGRGDSAESGHDKNVGPPAGARTGPKRDVLSHQHSVQAEPGFDPIHAPVTIGIGSSEPYKQWGAPRFAELADTLASRGEGTIVLVGGKAEAALAAEIQSLAPSRAITAAIGWDLTDIAALFSLSVFYVGNDTGVMNMAAAVGIRTYCLFGAVPPFHHSSRIVPITPPGGISKSDGMARISVAQVMREIEADQASSRS